MGCIEQRESGKQLTIQEWNIGIDNVYLSRLCSGGVFDSFKCLLGYLATLYVNKISMWGILLFRYKREGG